MSLAVTGHRHSNAVLEANLTEVEAVLSDLFDHIDARMNASPHVLGEVRLHNLLAEGVDQITARSALERGWLLVAPLPFGSDLNCAINAMPTTASDARALAQGGEAQDADVQARATALKELVGKARVFQLAEQDALIEQLYLAALEKPTDFARQRAFEAQSNDRVGMAGQIMIERADLLIAVWDGKVSNLRGGTGHTVIAALECACPVLLIDPANPESWTILTRPEDVLTRPGNDIAALDAIIDRSINIVPEGARLPIDAEQWHGNKSRIWGLYRWLEKTFSGSARPAAAADITSAEPGRPVSEAARDLPVVDAAQLEAIEHVIEPQFEWTDGISSWLSDAYRSGMCLNFILAAFAVIIGAAYLPLELAAQKWIFASIELLLLLLIVAITLIGKRYDWHGRWFETRRVAEYLRHGPIMILLGVIRPAGRWPRSEGSDWPENYGRHSLRSTGLPEITLSQAYLREAARTLLLSHVRDQQDYHTSKARRLLEVDHRLDKLAETLFILAIISVSIYLALKLGATVDVLPYAWPTAVSLTLTFLGIALPTSGASIAGIRFFCDFERFSAISQVTAGKLSDIGDRISLLLDGPDDAISYRTLREVTHGVDAIVVEELESWQAVFSGKHISLPA
ncbi:hypothetical protein [Erythrobacter alti]|uniref:hypothetical protein n=1 Tax=Erythrobacter alti TaxID=1896145 RepID=UPI0030F419F6